MPICLIVIFPYNKITRYRSIYIPYFCSAKQNVRGLFTLTSVSFQLFIVVLLYKTSFATRSNFKLQIISLLWYISFNKNITIIMLTFTTWNIHGILSLKCLLMSIFNLIVDFNGDTFYFLDSLFNFTITACLLLFFINVLLYA